MSHVRLLLLLVLGLSFTNRVAAAPKPIVEITEHIARDTRWSADQVYVVSGEIHVRIIGVTSSEWEIGNLHSDHSGDDGVDFDNSDLTLRGLTVTAPSEDGVNITSSRVSITASLVIDMTDTGTDDRDLFDMEWDESRPFLRLARDCKVHLAGVFGDEMTLISDDLPPPHGKVLYSFGGRLRVGQTYIYARDD